MTRLTGGRQWSPLWVQLVAGVLLLLGIGTWLLPTRTVPAINVVVSPSPQGRPATDTRADSVAGIIVRTNLFSASRHTPRVRFVLPGQEPTATAPVMDPMTPPSSAPELQGVLMVNGIWRALLLLPGADSVPRVVQTGDRVGGYRVRAVGADRVELSSGSGTRIVRLRRKLPSDSNGVEP